MHKAIVFCLTLMPVLAQQVTWLSNHSGRITRDAQGNWFIVETVEQNVGNRDLRVRKLNPDLTLTLWSRVIGGTGSEEVQTLLANSGGALLLLGNTSSKDLPVTQGVLATTPPHGPSSAFLMKFDPSGDVTFSTYLHDGTDTWAENLLQLRNDSIVLALTGRLWHIDLRGTSQIREVLSPWIRGPMQLDDYGKLWVAGTMWSDNLPATANAFQLARQSGTCYSFVGPTSCSTGFVIRLNASSGAIEAATYLGGKLPVSITGIKVDLHGAPIVMGNVQGGLESSDFPTTPGSFQAVVRTRNSYRWYGGRAGVWSTPVVARLTPDLDRLTYGTYLAGARSERATWLSVDRMGRVIVAGDTVSRDFPGTGAFTKPCGPNLGLKTPLSSFVTRLSADGGSLDGSAVLFGSSIGVPFNDHDGVVVIPNTKGLVQVSLDTTDQPVIACTVNGANFRTENFVAPRQLLTLIGAGIPSGARLLFDNIPAELLYLAPDQINAVVPAEIRGRESTQMALEVDGVHSNLRVFNVWQTNPTVKVFVKPDGTLEDRGNPLADVRLESGAQNGIENPARRGEMVEIYTTGLDLASPVEVFMPDHHALPVEALAVEDGAGGVQKLRVRISETANLGVVTIAIQNGGRRTVDNAGFVWVR